MKARFSFGILSAVCLVLIGVSVASAQNTYNRISVIEEFTSATCPPCVAATPVLARVVQLSNGVVSVRYHLDFPAPGDPWNVANPAENSSRQTYYSVSGIPTSRVNGKSTVDPRDEATLIARVQADNAAKSPIRITVTQPPTGGSVTVKVETNIALSGQKLHVALLSRNTALPDLPQTLPNSNGEADFEDAMLKMLPNAAGTSLNIAAGESQEFTFPYVKGNSSIWPQGQQYVVAFVQNTGGTREVLQGGTNLNEVQAIPVLSGAKWQFIGRAEQKSVVVSVSNPGNAPIEAAIVVKNTADLTAAGWTVSLSNDVVALPAGGSKDVTVMVRAPNRSWFAGILLETSPTNLTSGIAKSATLEFGFLTEGTRAAVYYGASNGAVISGNAALASTFGTDVAYMPYATEILSAFNPTGFDAAIFPAGFDGRFNMVAFTPVIQAMTNAGKGVWLQAPVGLAVAFNEANQQFAGYPETKAWFEELGLSLRSTASRAQTVNGGTQIMTFQMAGTAGDPIGAGFTCTANTYHNVNWPFYTTAQDLIAINPQKQTFSWAFADGTATNSTAIRNQNSSGGKVVFSTWGPELIGATEPRNSITQKVLSWLLTSNAPNISLSTSTLNYGDVKVNANKDLSVTITNTGNSVLLISSVGLGGTDPASFSIVSGGPSSGNISIAPNATHRIVAKFSPAFEGMYVASLLIESNTGTTTTVVLRGTGSPASGVETESTSPSGAIALRLVGSNPVTTSSDIELTTTGAGTENVTVSVVDVMGRTIATLFNGAVSVGTQRLSLNAADLAGGMYTIVATNGSERTALTVVAGR